MQIRIQNIINERDLDQQQVHFTEKYLEKMLVVVAPREIRSEIQLIEQRHAEIDQPENDMQC
jgi:hypothetical protein